MSQGNMSLSSVIDLVSQEKGIDRSVLVEATEQAILTAAKRTFGPDRELLSLIHISEPTRPY